MGSSISAKTTTFQRVATSIGCVNPATGISLALGSPIARIVPIPALSSATPVSLTKGLQFSGQPVKIMDSELFLAIGLVSCRMVRCKGFG
jgi:hypothetical protein